MTKVNELMELTETPKKNKKPKVEKATEVNKTTELVEDIKVEKEEITVSFTNSALGLVKNPDSTYSIVKIPYNLNDNVVGKIEVIDTADSRHEAEARYKMNVVRENIFE